MKALIFKVRFFFKEFFYIKMCTFKDGNGNLKKPFIGDVIVADSWFKVLWFLLESDPKKNLTRFNYDCLIYY